MPAPAVVAACCRRHVPHAIGREDVRRGGPSTTKRRGRERPRRSRGALEGPRQAQAQTRGLVAGRPRWGPARRDRGRPDRQACPLKLSAHGDHTGKRNPGGAAKVCGRSSVGGAVPRALRSRSGRPPPAANQRCRRRGWRSGGCGPTTIRAGSSQAPPPPVRGSRRAVHRSAFAR